MSAIQPARSRRPLASGEASGCEHQAAEHLGEPMRDAIAEVVRLALAVDVRRRACPRWRRRSSRSPAGGSPTAAGGSAPLELFGPDLVERARSRHVLRLCQPRTKAGATAAAGCAPTPAAASRLDGGAWAVKPGSLAAVSEATILACTWPRLDGQLLDLVVQRRQLRLVLVNSFTSSSVPTGTKSLVCRYHLRAGEGVRRAREDAVEGVVVAALDGVELVVVTAGRN